MFGKGDVFVFVAALVSLLFSIALWFGLGVTSDRDAGVFVGLWVPSILSAGMYLHVAQQRPK